MASPPRIPNVNMRTLMLGANTLATRAPVVSTLPAMATLRILNRFTRILVTGAARDHENIVEK